MIKSLRFGMPMTVILVVGFCSGGCGRGMLPATESQQVLLKAHLEKWLPDPDKEAILHGSTSGDPGAPMMLSLESRRELLRLLLASFGKIAYTDKPFGKTSGDQFSMSFSQAVVFGGAREDSPMVLVVARLDDGGGERVVIQPVGIGEIPGHFSTVDPAVILWFKNATIRR